jgi:hypothetical protein
MPSATHWLVNIKHNEAVDIYCEVFEHNDEYWAKAR